MNLFPAQALNQISALQFPREEAVQKNLNRQILSGVLIGHIDPFRDPGLIAFRDGFNIALGQDGERMLDVGPPPLLMLIKY